MNRKPGDWNCSSCDHMNFGWREACQRCSEPKPGDGYAGRVDDRGDYGRRGSSFGFGSGYNSAGGGDYGRGFGGGGDYRGGSYGGGGGAGGGGGGGGGDYGRNYGSSYGSYGGSEVRPGDWYCHERSCGAHNFASRNNCFKCGASKEDEKSGGYEFQRGGDYDSGGSRGGYGFSSSITSAEGGNRAGWKSGDWICTRSGCNEHNFASRMECFRCQAPRESALQ